MRMVIILNEQERQALNKAAADELRMPRDHVRYILREHLERHGMLASDQAQRTARPQPAAEARK